MKFPTLIIAMSLLTHLLFFGYPKQVVFDEVYMGNFVSSYSQERYYFDIHPPLAKIIDHLVGRIMNVDYDHTDFSLIGNNFNSSGIVYLRILPVMAGIMLPLVVYFICLNMGFSGVSSFLVGILICLENSLIVQSRFILFDSLLIIFGFSSLLFYLIYIKDERKKYILFLSTIFASMAFSIKWTGLAYPLLICIYEIIRAHNIKKILKISSLYFFVGFLIYLTAFAIHFSFFPPSSQGFISRFLDLNMQMLMANKTLTATHPYGSKWYTWPLMIRSVFYWQDIDKGQYIYFIGNPLIYLLGTISTMFLCVYVFLKKERNKIALFITLGFLVNFIPFAFIGRVMFLYHYEAALVFSIIAFGFILDLITLQAKKTKVCFVVIVVCACFFAYFSPLTYGIHLENKQLESRMWLSTWR